MLIVFMGVSGSGKSHMARLLAESINAIFLEGDDFHPKHNIDKMQAGIALTDEDRWPWLAAIKQELMQLQGQNTVLAASLLKEAHRVASGVRDYADRLYVMQGERALIQQRLQQRELSGQHFMPASLLDSQIANFELPQDAVAVPIDQSPADALQYILNDLQQAGLWP